MYERTWDRLGAAGYDQYEVSNFARPGHQCLHNVNTWRMAQWVGLGPSGASQHGGWRSSNIANLEEWAAQVDRGERSTEDRTLLTPSLLVEDSLVFGLRMNEGVDLERLRDRCPLAAWQRVWALVERLVSEGLAARDGSRVRLERRGRLLADSVGMEVMSAFRAPEPAATA